MLRRLVQSAATLATIIVAYQCYVLVALPLLEPPIAVRESGHATEGERAEADRSVSRYQDFLAAYFPAGHWSLKRPPKVIENETGSVMFVLDDYQRSDDGRVEISHFAVLMFPTPRQQSTTPPRDAVILEAPQGAHLQFDDNFRPERGQVGQIIHGEFPGPITIRSDMRDPGPEDDLWLETSDLAMNSKIMFTPKDVHFRFGPNSGSGREMEIRFLELDQNSSKKSSLNIAGADSLEIRRDVQLRLFLGSQHLFPGQDTHDKPVAASKPSPLGRGQGEGASNSAAAPRRLPSANAKPAVDPQQPVEVTCTGPFRFDFIKYVASFDQHVEARQINPQGQSDQLSCEQLDVEFARKAEAAAKQLPIGVDPGRRQREDVRYLEPSALIAQGYPVVITSPTRGPNGDGVEVRGRRVQLQLRQRKVLVEGGQDVCINFGQNVLRAPKIEYQHPAPDSATKIGNFRADGPGKLRYLPDPKKPDEIFEAAWQATIELTRSSGQPVLNMAGRPWMAMNGAGQLTADQIRVYLRELEADGKTKPVPDRMNAFGQVEINSPQLLAHTRELVANFHNEPEVPVANTPAAGGAPPPQSPTANILKPTKPSGTPGKTYQLIADQLQLEVTMRGQKPAPTSLACNGNVAFREVPQGDAGEQPFEVSGGQLTADQLDGQSTAHITVRGAAPDQSPDPKLAAIKARGMTINSAAVELDEKQNRVWSDGPGTATVLLPRDLSGQPTATPTPLNIQWEGGLNFDGRYVMVRQNVLVEGADDRLRCDELAGKLSSAINFGQPTDRNAIDIAEVECRGNVAMDHRTRDGTGLTSVNRMELTRLSVNQKTGAISGDGPGTIRSTHFADQAGSLTGIPSQNDPRAPAAGNKQLHFLRVDFQQGLAGNQITREIEFRGRVRTVYGAVDAWEQELDIDRPETILPGTLTLTSDNLRVNEDPIAATRAASHPPTEVAGHSLGPVQMHAEGNVRIDGESPQHGLFAATADRASYEQSKELFILDGPPRIPASIWYQQQLGGRYFRQDAEKIQYARLTNEVITTRGRMIEFTPGETATPPPPRSAAAPAIQRQ